MILVNLVDLSSNWTLNKYIPSGNLLILNWFLVFELMSLIWKTVFPKKLIISILFILLLLSFSIVKKLLCGKGLGYTKILFSLFSKAEIKLISLNNNFPYSRWNILIA